MHSSDMFFFCRENCPKPTPPKAVTAYFKFRTWGIVELCTHRRESESDRVSDLFYILMCVYTCNMYVTVYVYVYLYVDVYMLYINVHT